MNRRSFLGLLAAIGAAAFGLNRGKVVGGSVSIDVSVTKPSSYIVGVDWAAPGGSCTVITTGRYYVGGQLGRFDPDKLSPEVRKRVVETIAEIGRYEPEMISSETSGA